MNRPRLLDSFSGMGGTVLGYQRAGFHVTAVEKVKARADENPADVVIIGDALEHLNDHGHEYDANSASPTCTGYSQGTVALPDRLERYDRLIPAVRDLLRATGKPYVIENVEGARSELIDPLTLCWTHFHQPGSVIDEDGTPLWMKRHRLFESNVFLWPAGECNHPTDMQCAGAYGGARRDKHEARNIRHGGYVPSLPVMRELLGTPWMNEKGCQLSIPPVYAEHIGRQLLAHINQEAAA